MWLSSWDLSLLFLICEMEMLVVPRTGLRGQYVNSAGKAQRGPGIPAVSAQCPQWLAPPPPASAGVGQGWQDLARRPHSLAHKTSRGSHESVK